MILEHPFRVLPLDDDGQVRSCESALHSERAVGTTSLLCAILNLVVWYNFPNSPEDGNDFYITPMFCTGANWGLEELGNLPGTAQLVLKELNLNFDLSGSEAQALSICPFWLAKCGWSQPVGTGLHEGGGQRRRQWAGITRMLTQENQTDQNSRHDIPLCECKTQETFVGSWLHCHLKADILTF